MVDVTLGAALRSRTPLFLSHNSLTHSHLGTAQRNLSLTSGSKIAPLETFGGQERLCSSSGGSRVRSWCWISNPHTSQILMSNTWQRLECKHVQFIYAQKEKAAINFNYCSVCESAWRTKETVLIERYIRAYITCLFKQAWMRVIVPGGVISVSPRVEKNPFSFSLVIYEQHDWDNCCKYLNQIAASLPSDVHLAFNCLHGRAVRRLLTLCRACLNVNTNTDLDVCVPWESQKDTKSRGPDPSDILTCYIISLGYSITPIKLSFSAGNHLSKYVFQMSGQGFDSESSVTLPVPSFPPSSARFSWEHSPGKLSFHSFIIPPFSFLEAIIGR